MDGLRPIFLGACFVFPFGFLRQESPEIQWMSLIEMMMEIPIAIQHGNDKGQERTI